MHKASPRVSLWLISIDGVHRFGNIFANLIQATAGQFTIGVQEQKYVAISVGGPTGHLFSSSGRRLNDLAIEFRGNLDCVVLASSIANDDLIGAGTLGRPDRLGDDILFVQSGDDYRNFHEAFIPGRRVWPNRQFSTPS